jgi:hypothetical protein
VRDRKARAREGEGLDRRLTARGGGGSRALMLDFACAVDTGAGRGAWGVMWCCGVGVCLAAKSRMRQATHLGTPLPLHTLTIPISTPSLLPCRPSKTHR